MTQTIEQVDYGKTRTGHRPGRNPEDPRNSTVCFMVTETEKTMIDALGFCTNLRRSAILTRIVTTFLNGAMYPENYEDSKKGLLAFLKECRKAVEEKPGLVKQAISQASHPNPTARGKMS